MTSDQKACGESSTHQSRRASRLTVGHWPLAVFLLLVCGGCVRREAGVIHLQFSFWGSVFQQQVEEQIVARFEQTHPRIKIDLLPVGAHYAEKVQAMMVGDIAPDVIMVEVTQSFEWAARGVLMDLTSDMAQLRRQATLMPVPERAFAPDGRFYSLPINCPGFAMYYNQDALTRAGIDRPDPQVSWDRIREIAPLLSARHGDPRASTDYAMLLPPPVIFFWQWGADVFDDQFHPTRVTINSPSGLAAMNFLRALHATGCVVPPEVSNDQGTYQLFRDGKVAFFFAGRWNTPDLVGQTAFRWDVAPIPRGPVSGVTMHGGTGLSVSSKTRHPEAAREFVRFYASPAGSALAMRGTRYVPVYRELAFGDEFLGLRPPSSIRHFAETMEQGASRAICYTPGLAEVMGILNSRFEQALSQPQVPSETILAGLEVDLSRWLKRDRRKRGR